MKMFYILICMTLSACGQQYYTENLDRAYIKDCNDRGGKVERILYSDQLQCVGATTKGTSK
jgi:hypothetical protein